MTDYTGVVCEKIDIDFCAFLMESKAYLHVAILTESIIAFHHIEVIFTCILKLHFI